MSYSIIIITSHFISYRYKENKDNKKEKFVQLFPNHLNQDIFIRQLKACSVYELKVRLKPPRIRPIYLKLDDFQTGPHTKISSLQIQNVTDTSATIEWDPKEYGMQCATAFVVNGNLASLEVKPSKFLTTWSLLQSCTKYAVQVFPKFGDKIGQCTSTAFTTFPSHTFFDAMLDESRQYIFWQTNQNFIFCKESIKTVVYQLKILKCLSNRPSKTIVITLEHPCIEDECGIDMTTLEKELAENVQLTPNSHYIMTLSVELSNINHEKLILDILPDINFVVIGSSNRSRIINERTRQDCRFETEHPFIQNDITQPQSNGFVNESEKHSPTLIAVTCVTSFILILLIFTCYVYRNQTRQNVDLNVVHRISNVGPHYLQYYQGPTQDRISIILE